MTDEHVKISTELAGIVQLQLTRPEKKNALTQAMYRTLARALSAADDDPAVRVITLTGSGDSFCSGNDVADFIQADGAGTGAGPVAEAAPGAAMEFLAAISAARKPVLAAVNGMAVGIGVTLLLHCDLVYAADAATFTLPFSNLGLVPEAASTQFLPALIGHQRSAQLLFFGEPIDAGQAAAIGFVNEVVPAGQLAGHVVTRAMTLAKKPAAAILATKALLRRPPESVAARMEAETSQFLRLLHSPESRAILQGFLKRRR